MAATGHSQGTTEDFDNSFDYFEGSEKDPWNGQTWGKNASLDSSFDSSFDDGLFEFSATSSVQGLDADLDSQSLFFTDPFSLTPPRKEGPVTIRVAMHEQLSALYDDESADTSCQVEGSIHVKPTTDIKGPFHLTIRDVMNQLGRIEVKPDICRDVSDKISRKDLQKQDRVLRVSLPPNAMNQEIPIARYYCELSLRPVPMLVKCRVQSGGKFSRVGFKVRANPTNKCTLTRLVILLAVPPYVQGDDVRMSRKGGAWDEMKRTISWTVDKLDPGEALEIQAQFESVDLPNGGGGAPKFPLLVRAEYATLFSSIELNSDFIDALSCPVKTKLTQSGRILHRKV